MFHYRLYDLHILANFSMSELSIENEDIPIDITFKLTNIEDVVERLRPHLIQSSFAHYKNETLLLIKEIGSFWIKNKKEIFLQLLEDCPIEKALPHIYSTVMAILLQMRDLFPIHASAVNNQKGIHLFCGPSGIGKSTLATHLNAKGFPLFCDDKCVLYWAEKERRFFAKRAIPTVRLCTDAIELLDDVAWLKNGKAVTYKDNKVEFDVSQWVTAQDMPVASISLIRNLSYGRLGRREVTGTEKMAFIQNQSFKKVFIQALGKQEQHFDFLEKLYTEIPFYAIRRPVNTPIHRFANFIEWILNQDNTSIQ